MDGYWKNDVDSHRALQDGWLLTGDIGRIDADGHLVITDRKKDILVNDKGDNISPARIEGMLTLQPEILQAMVHGDRRPYLVGLVVPDPEWALDWARDRGMPRDLARLQRRTRVRPRAAGGGRPGQRPRRDAREGPPDRRRRRVRSRPTTAR